MQPTHFVLDSMLVIISSLGTLTELKIMRFCTIAFFNFSSKVSQFGPWFIIPENNCLAFETKSGNFNVYLAILRNLGGFDPWNSYAWMLTTRSSTRTIKNG